MTQREHADGLAPVLIALFRGVLYRDQSADLWQYLMALRAQVADHARVFGLELMVDEAEGYAFLKQREIEAGEPELPRLVQRRQMGFTASLLLALLRKKMVEHDAGGGDVRLILSREQIAEEVKIFLPDSPNEAKLIDRIDADLNRIVELGFLRKLRGQENQFEVRRILKAFVDAQWLADFEARLAQYRAYAKESDATR